MGIFDFFEDTTPSIESEEIVENKAPLKLLIEALNKISK